MTVNGNGLQMKTSQKFKRKKHEQMQTNVHGLLSDLLWTIIDVRTPQSLVRAGQRVYKSLQAIVVDLVS